MRVEKIITMGEKVLKEIKITAGEKVLTKVEQKGLLLGELGKLEKSAIKPGKPLETTLASLPREVQNFDRVTVNEGNGFLTEVLSFKNSNNETLVKTIKRTQKGGDSFLTIRKYGQDATSESMIIDTNKFQNNELRSSQLTTMIKDMYEDIFTKTNFVRTNMEGKASHDTYSIGEYRYLTKQELEDGMRNPEFKFSFDRDFNGHRSSSVNIEKVPEGCNPNSGKPVKFEISEEDKSLLPMVFNRNKAEVLNDFAREEFLASGLSLPPRFEITDQFEDIYEFTSKSEIGGELITYVIKDVGGQLVPVYDIPTIRVSDDTAKEIAIGTLSHEFEHLKNEIQYIPNEVINSMSEPAKSWYLQNTKNRIMPQRGSQEESKMNAWLKANYDHIQTEIELRSGKINKSEAGKRYLEEDALEADPKKNDEGAGNLYHKLFLKFLSIFQNLDWRALDSCS